MQNNELCVKVWDGYVSQTLKPTSIPKNLEFSSAIFAKGDTLRSTSRSSRSGAWTRPEKNFTEDVLGRSTWHDERRKTNEMRKSNPSLSSVEDIQGRTSSQDDFINLNTCRELPMQTTPLSYQRVLTQQTLSRSAVASGSNWCFWKISKTSRSDCHPKSISWKN